MLTVLAPASTTAFDIFSRKSGSVRAPSSAENSTSSTCRRGALDIQRAGARQGRHLHPGVFAADRIHRFEIAIGRDGEAGFENVHTQFHELPRHAKLFRNR